MEKRQQILLSYYLGLVFQVLGIILLFLFIIAMVWFNMNQGKEIEELKKKVNASVQENAGLSGRIAALTREGNTLREEISSLKDERDRLKSNVSSLTSKIAGLDSKVRFYLDSKGEPCENESEACLEKLVEVLSRPPDFSCSTVQDGICPSKCTQANDYDCCINRGNRWVSGKGCYVRP